LIKEKTKTTTINLQQSTFKENKKTIKDGRRARMPAKEKQKNNNQPFNASSWHKLLQVD